MVLRTEAPNASHGLRLQCFYYRSPGEVGGLKVLTTGKDARLTALIRASRSTQDCQAGRCAGEPPGKQPANTRSSVLWRKDTESECGEMGGALYRWEQSSSLREMEERERGDREHWPCWALCSPEAGVRP